MCENCNNRTQVEGLRRQRIWELSGGWHCAIIGTCLTLRDLRALARKLQVKTVSGYSVDYQLHGCFVREAEIKGKPARMLNKLLDKRHASAVRKSKDLRTEQDLSKYWQSALQTGDIPGPLWAILSHPVAPQDLCKQIYADVHMLSHMVGASNRADIRHLRMMKEEVASFEQQLAKTKRQYRHRLQSKDREIDILRKKWYSASARVARSKEPATSPDPEPTNKMTRALQEELERLSIKATKSDDMIRRQQNKIDELEATLQTMRQETSSLEQALLRRKKAWKDDCPLDLAGRCLLYVGGRQHTVHHLRQLVEEWNGQFIHHDGGIERSINELARCIVKADAVVFPTDCVSHSAANKVKKLCVQSMKPYVPLRNSGVASFVAGLKDGIKNLAPRPEIN